MVVEFLDTMHGGIGQVAMSTEDEKEYVEKYGKHWVLADGRSCNGSRYQIISGISFVPNFESQVNLKMNSSNSSFLTINYFIKIN